MLKQIATVTLDGAERFEASEHFGSRRGDLAAPVVNIDPSELGTVHADFNLHYKNKAEKNVSATTLTVYTVDADYAAHREALIAMAHGPLHPGGVEDMSCHAPIFGELGDRAETYLSHVWQLLLKQPTGGEDGLLLRLEAHKNIFYVRGSDGILRVVSPHTFEVYPDAGYLPWSMLTFPLDYPVLRPGDRVFSR